MITYETRTTAFPEPNERECPDCERTGGPPCDCYPCRTCEAPGVFDGQPECMTCRREAEEAREMADGLAAELADRRGREARDARLEGWL